MVKAIVRGAYSISCINSLLYRQTEVSAHSQYLGLSAVCGPIVKSAHRPLIKFLYKSYRKQGQFEWASPCILFISLVLRLPLRINVTIIDS